MASCALPKRTVDDKRGIFRLIFLPSKWCKPNSHRAILSCSTADPTLLIMLALYEIIAMLSMLYGLFGSILSTEGMLSKSKSYDMGIPRAGQVSGIGILQKSSLVTSRLCLRVNNCRHNIECGLSRFLVFCCSRMASRFLILYSRIYAASSALVFWPFWCLRSILFLDWHARQTFCNTPLRGVKPDSSFSVSHLMQCFTALMLNCLTDLQYKPNCKESKDVISPHGSIRGFFGRTR